MTSPKTARDVMTTGVLTVEAEMTVGDLAAFLLDNEISGAPVVADGRLVGVVSLTDLARLPSQGGTAITDRRCNPRFYETSWEPLDLEDFREVHIENASATVGDIMTPAHYDVGPEAPISEIVATMLSSHIHRVLVTAGDHLLGIVSSGDLLRLLLEEDELRAVGS